MQSFIDSVKSELKSGKAAFLVLVFTVARVIYGWSWLESGFHKLAWLSDGKANSIGKIETLVTNIAGPEIRGFDPLYLNKLFAWIADTFFIGMPGLTDALVVILEIAVGIAMILGFKVFWFALIAMFMNVQFIAAGSFNNFGYIWTNLVFMQFSRYVELIGVDGFLRSRKGMDLIATKARFGAAK